MPAVAKQEAINELAGAFAGPMSDDDLADLHNEMFPRDGKTVAEVAVDREGVLRRVLDHVEQGLEPEEIVDLWNVAHPGHRGVYFDESDNLLRFDDASDSSDGDDDD